MNGVLCESFQLFDRFIVQVPYQSQHHLQPQPFKTGLSRPRFVLQREREQNAMTDLWRINSLFITVRSEETVLFIGGYLVIC